MAEIWKIALAGLLAVSSVSAVAAQERYVDPDQCVADMTKLDTDNDGYIENTEAASYTQIETTVDTNGDGRISNEEKTVACRDGLVTAFKPPQGD